MGQGLIVQLNTLIFQVAIRGFFAPIVKFLFYLIENSIDLMYELAGHRYGLNEEIERFSQNFFTIFVIFMIFRLTLSMLSYIVNPDSFADKSSGFSKLILKVVISLVLLVSINPIFKLMYNIQDDVLFGDSNVIDNLILDKQEIYTVSVGGEEQDIYVTRMSDKCPEGYNAYSFTKGGIFSIMALKPFYQPTDVGEVDDSVEYAEEITENKNGYCGFNFENADGEAFFNDDVPATIETLEYMPHTGSQYVNHNIYENMVGGDGDIHHEEDFVIDFRYFWALIFGVVVLLLIITYCFDVVIRAFTLFLYQLIAPVPIISYMSPDKKNSDMLGNWAKKTASCWASLFVRFIVLDFVIYFTQIALNSFNNDDAGLVVQLFVLLGLLMFAKKLPKLIEEVIPGLKFGGLQLNPFKRISQEALGGNAALGAGAAIGAAGLSGLANFGTRTAEMGQNIRNAEGWRNKLSAFGRGAARTAGSTIAGATSAGRRAFMRTSKDGNIFGGIRSGHLEAQFAKKQREDLGRKGSTMMGRLASDANRWIGREDAAQRMNREILEEEARNKTERKAFENQKRTLDNKRAALNDQKTTIQNERDKSTKDYRAIKSAWDKMNKRINSQKPVKDELDKLEMIKNTDFDFEANQQRDNLKLNASNQINSIKESYNNRLKLATNDAQKIQLQSQMNQEIAKINNKLSQDLNNISSEQIKENKIKEQDRKVKQAQYEYFMNNKDSDEVLRQHIGDIESIKAGNAEINNDERFNFITDDGSYNKNAVYAADDKITTISHTWDQREAEIDQQMYQINIDAEDIAKKERILAEKERVTAARKESEEYQSAMADLAAQRITQPEPENWMSSPGNETSTGYGGFQLHSRSGGAPRGGGGGPHGGGGPRP